MLRKGTIEGLVWFVCLLACSVIHWIIQSGNKFLKGAMDVLLLLLAGCRNRIRKKKSTEVRTADACALFAQTYQDLAIGFGPPPLGGVVIGWVVMEGFIGRRGWGGGGDSNSVGLGVRPRGAVADLTLCLRPTLP